MVRFYPSSAYHQLGRVKTNQLRQLLRLHRTNICESNKFFKILAIVPVDACSGDHFGQLIKSGNTHKERMMSQTINIIHTFKKV